MGGDWYDMAMTNEGFTCPNMRSGCDMKSVIRSSILRGSNTKVGNVTLDRSIPTLSWDIKDEMIEPSLSSLYSASES